MTLEEKRTYVLKFCKEQQNCGSCPCKWVCHKTAKRIDNMFVWQLNEVIREIQKCDSQKDEVEQELAECEDQKTRKADLVESANAYCRMIPSEYCETTKIAPCAMCMASPFEFDDWTKEDLVKFIEECLKLSADGFFEKKDDDYDTVERPQHYASTSIECIDAMRETQGVEAVKSFCICNAFKYLWRHNGKNGDEDIRKASWYLNKAVELMGDKHDN